MEVLTLYLRGARMGEPRVGEPGMIGDLVSHRLRHRTLLVLSAVSSPSVLKLYEPRFASADAFGIYLDGYEIVEDTHYRQCWRLRMVTAAPMGAGRKPTMVSES